MIVPARVIGLFGAAAAATLLVADGCSRRAESALISVRVALTTDAISWHPIRLAQTHGFAAREGLALDISDATGMSKGLEALVGGSVEVAAGQLGQAIQLVAEGSQVRCFLAMYSRPLMALAVAPARAGQIRTIVDLKGKHVGVSTPGSGTHQLLNVLLAKHGLTPEDVSIVSVGVAAGSIAALEHNTVDAAVLVASSLTTFEARHPGATFLADPRTADEAKQLYGVAVFPAGGLIARDRWLQTNHDVALRLVRAIKGAMRWIATHSPQEVRASIPEELRMPDEEADLRAIRFAQETMLLDGTIPPDAPAAVFRYVAAASDQIRNAHVDLDAIYTNEFASAK